MGHTFPPLPSPLLNPQPLVSPLARSPAQSPLGCPPYTDPLLQNELTEVKHLLKCSLESKKGLESALETATKENQASLQHLADLKEQMRGLAQDLELVTKQKEELEKRAKEKARLESERNAETKRQKKANQDLLGELLTTQRKTRGLELQLSEALVRLNRSGNQYQNLIDKRKREHTQEIQDVTKEMLSAEARHAEAVLQKEKEWRNERSALQEQIQSLQQQLATQHARQVKNKRGGKNNKDQREEEEAESRLKKRRRRTLPRKCKSQ